MEPKHLFTLRWTQPYPTSRLRPYLRQLHEELELAIEAQLDYGNMLEAKQVIERIKNASKS